MAGAIFTPGVRSTSSVIRSRARDSACGLEVFVETVRGRLRRHDQREDDCREKDLPHRRVALAA